ncbi:MAG: CHASE2 domain-containing protein [Leptolyngbyaceae cyanobacterium bins.302]|nr:CHASE2 domain-containing protein [Leptolyngbyaceae cyanobacterium bins.302]
MNRSLLAHAHVFQLKVQALGQICLFELVWGKGQSLTVQVAYPTDVIQVYQDWQQAYLGFYQSGQLRGRAGNIAVSMDWRTKLNETEKKLKDRFHYWLRSAALYELRSRITTAGQPSNLNPSRSAASIQLFLTCSPIELERLPWESWNLGNEFGLTEDVQILRSPLNVRDAAFQEVSQPKGKRARILAILGDDTGLNFEADRQAVASLQKVADIQFVGWQPKQTATQVIQQITDAIAHPSGWDVLFFAGHSKETELTGGELSVAPGVNITLQSLMPQLAIAKQHGLQVAIFNSCNGLSLANALIDLGLSQVAVMREPIHNAVAQQFLWQFLGRLGQQLDVYDAIQLARDFLETQQSIYPSTALIPSLFCHPGAERFRIPHSVPHRLRALRPSWVEAIALCTGLTLSLQIPVQDGLLDARLLCQAYYRALTKQVPAQTEPAIALIQIDQESIYRQGLSQVHPIDRSYLAQLIDRMQQLDALIIGIDILLDTRQPGDKALAAIVQRAVEQQTWLIFSAILDGEGELGVSQATGIASPNWMMQGYTDALSYFLEMPNLEVCERTCPFSYLLALVQSAKQDMPHLPQPALTRDTDLRTEFLQRVGEATSTSDQLTALKTIQSPLGLQPLVDFSIPPDRVYERIPAWKLLDPNESQSLRIQPNQLVLIAGGCDDRLGFSMRQADCFPAPKAIAFWTQQSGLTGGELLAYMTHHFLTQRLVVPIPDWWMVGLAALIGKGVVLGISYSQRNGKRIQRYQILGGTVGAIAIYGLVTLQLYISGAILLPWLLPSGIFLIYISATLRGKHYD